jgi:SAM-dependent methyltransferase
VRDWRGALTRRYARLVTDAVTRWPPLWRLLRRPLRWRFDGLAPHWDRLRTCGGLPSLAAALEQVREPPSALDLGTGTGEAAFLVARRFPAAEVTGLDLSPGMIEEARRKLPAELDGRVRFLVGDAARLPFADGSFELVTLANMIPFWDELARVVAPGGAAVFAFGAGPATPIYVSPERLRAALERRGFLQFAEFEVAPGTALLARKAVGS